MDDLSVLIGELRLESSMLFRSRLAAPWGIAFEPSPNLRFHALLEGECWFGGEAIEPLHIREMELVVVVGEPHKHWVADRPGRALVPSVQASAACEVGRPFFQDGRPTEILICAQSSFVDGDAARALFGLIPRYAKLSREDEGAERLWRLVESIDQEHEARAPGHETVIDRLLEAVFVSLVRRTIDPMIASSGIAQALRDSRLPRALRAVHARPERRWTLVDLAEVAGMSRAVFARRFKDATDMTPMAYVTALRIAKAKRLLRIGSTVDRVAAAAGYATTEGFRKRFERSTGMTPAAFQRTVSKGVDGF